MEGYEKKLENENNYVSWISLEQFLKLAQERIGNPKEKFDEGLADITGNLFPEVEPTVWAPILIFYFSPYNPDNRVKSVIEHPWNFGKSRSYLGSGEDNLFETMKSQIELEKGNTFELTVMLSKYYPLFKDISTRKSLERYIEELKALEGKYKDGSLEEIKRSSLLGVFTGMLEFLRTS